MSRRGRPRKRGVKRQPDDRPVPERVSPTSETVARRADAMAAVICIHPQMLAIKLSKSQDAGWYIGRLYLVEALTRKQRDAGDRWRRYARRYELMLKGPKPAGAVAMQESDGEFDSLSETKEQKDDYKKAKAAYERCWNAVAEHGHDVLNATTKALRGEEVPITMLREGLDAIVFNEKIT